MSSVLRKKIGAGGGLSPSVRLCAPLWAALSNAIAQWAQDVYGLAAMPEVSERKALTGTEIEHVFGDDFAFVDIEHSSGAVVALALNAAGAQKYAASRLRQDANNLKNAPELFLRLMSEHAARALWGRMSAVMSGSEPSDVPLRLKDYTGSEEAFDPDGSYLSLLFTLGDTEGEDSWLIESGGDSPGVRLILKMSEVKKLARSLQASTVQTVSEDAGGRQVLRERVRNTTVVLDAVLDSMSMTIGECSRLEVGQVISLPEAKMDRLMLSADTVSGSLPISHGELGTWKGFRALKLRSPVPEHVIREIMEI